MPWHSSTVTEGGTEGHTGAKVSDATVTGQMSLVYFLTEVDKVPDITNPCGLYMLAKVTVWVVTTDKLGLPIWGEVFIKT